MKKTLIPSLFAAALAVLLPSCNSESNSATTDDDTHYDMVTYASMSDKGSTYTLQKDDDSQPVTLTATARIDTTAVKVGQRVVIAYTLPSGVSAYTNSSINLKGYMTAVNDTIITDKAPTLNYNQKLISAWITGKYLNIHSQVSVAESAKRFELVLDEETVNNIYPTVYLVFEPDLDFDKVSSKSVYASFDISKLRYTLNARGFKLVWLPASGGGTGTQTFTLIDSSSIITPTE